MWCGCECGVCVFGFGGFVRQRGFWGWWVCEIGVERNQSGGWRAVRCERMGEKREERKGDEGTIREL